MSKPKNDSNTPQTPEPNPASSEPVQTGIAKVLIVESSNALRSRIAKALDRLSLLCVNAKSGRTAAQRLAREQFDVMICRFDTASEDLIEVANAAERAGTPLRIIGLTESADFGASQRAMRLGFFDLLLMPVDDSELCTRVDAAIASARRIRHQQRQIERLQRTCRRLQSAGGEVAQQVQTFCSDLANAYNEIADQMNNMTLASEFKSLIRQELDIEALLRTTLEYLLARTGPTNAAVFLPTSQSDFSLGAYVNYDVPKDTADVLLDHLADVIPPRFEDEHEVVYIRTPEEMQDWIGDDATWLEDSGMIIFSCHYEGECLGVITLFRDHRVPYKREVLNELGAIRDLLATQLGRVIDVHHRALPKQEWPGFDVDSGEDYDDIDGMAA